VSITHYLVNDSGSAIDITGYVRRGWTLEEKAEEGAVAMSSVTLDDPNMDLTVRGHRAFYSVESTAGTENIVYYGFVADQKVRRGDIKGGREWEITLADINSLLFKRVMTGSDTNRPAETDVARIEWLLTTDEGNAFNGTPTNVSTASPVNMDAYDYRGQMASQVIDDCAQQSGANWYLQYSVTDGDEILWYGSSDLSTYPSTLSLSNDPADLDTDQMSAGTATVWPLSEDTTLTIDPSRVYSGLYANWDGGATYRRHSTTETLYTWRRDAVMDWPNVHTAAKAQARADAQIPLLALPDERLVTTVTLPASLAHELRPGMSLDVKAMHLPDFTTAKSCRIMSRKVKQFGLDAYSMELELSPIAYQPIYTATVDASGDLGLFYATNSVLLSYSTTYYFEVSGYSVEGSTEDYAWSWTTGLSTGDLFDDIHPWITVGTYSTADTLATGETLSSNAATGGWTNATPGLTRGTFTTKNASGGWSESDPQTFGAGQAVVGHVYPNTWRWTVKYWTLTRPPSWAV